MKELKRPFQVSCVERGCRFCSIHREDLGKKQTTFTILKHTKHGIKIWNKNPFKKYSLEKDLKLLARIGVRIQEILQRGEDLFLADLEHKLHKDQDRTLAEGALWYQKACAIGFN